MPPTETVENWELLALSVSERQEIGQMVADALGVAIEESSSDVSPVDACHVR
jgi:hypothetical protein